MAHIKNKAKTEVRSTRQKGGGLWTKPGGMEFTMEVKSSTLTRRQVSAQLDSHTWECDYQREKNWGT